MNSRYSISNLTKEFRENKHIIEAYFKNQSIEGYDEEASKIMGMSVVPFLILLIISLSIWIWAVFVLVKYWKILPDWAKIIGLIGVIPVFACGGPVMTLIVVYVIINKPNSNYKFCYSKV